jgi:hypothetical protein
MDDESHRKLFFQVQKDVMNKAFQLEIEAGLREASKQPKSQATIHSLGGRFKKIRETAEKSSNHSQPWWPIQENQRPVEEGQGYF